MVHKATQQKGGQVRVAMQDLEFGFGLMKLQKLSVERE